MHVNTAAALATMGTQSGSAITQIMNGDALTMAEATNCKEVVMKLGVRASLASESSVKENVLEEPFCGASGVVVLVLCLVELVTRPVVSVIVMFLSSSVPVRSLAVSPVRRRYVPHACAATATTPAQTAANPISCAAYRNGASN